MLYKYLKDLQKSALEKFEGSNEVPTPDNWGGFLLTPEEIEFWQGNDIRLHDRLRFRRPRENEDLAKSEVTVGENDWVIERLAP